MNYEGFKEEVKANIKDFLPERFADATVEIVENNKLNESWDGLTLRIPGITMAPVINLNQMYRKYEETEDFGRVMNHVGQMIENNTPKKDPELDFVNDYSKAKEKLFIRLSNKNLSRKILDNIPHRSIEDIVISSSIMVENINGQVGSITVTKEMLKNYGITEDQLFKDTLENSPKINPAKIEDMGKLLSKMMGIPLDELDSYGVVPENNMLVVTNASMINGAASIFYPEVQEELAKTFGGDYVVMPSSINEVLVVPKGIKSQEDIEELIEHVNSTVLPPEELLSQHAFLYDSIDKCIVRMDKAVDHTKETKVEINLDKKYCEEMDDILIEGKKNYTVQVPEGTQLDGKDIGGYLFHPDFMDENPNNVSEMKATYYLSDKDGYEVKISGPEGDSARVDVKDLRNAINEQKEVAKEKDKAAEKTKEKSHVKEKDDSLEM